MTLSIYMFIASAQLYWLYSLDSSIVYSVWIDECSATGTMTKRFVFSQWPCFNSENNRVVSLFPKTKFLLSQGMTILVCVMITQRFFSMFWCCFSSSFTGFSFYVPACLILKVPDCFSSCFLQSLYSSWNQYFNHW